MNEDYPYYTSSVLPTRVGAWPMRALAEYVHRLCELSSHGVAPDVARDHAEDETRMRYDLAARQLAPR